MAMLSPPTGPGRGLAAIVADEWSHVTKLGREHCSWVTSRLASRYACDGSLCPTTPQEYVNELLPQEHKDTPAASKFLVHLYRGFKEY